MEQPADHVAHEQQRYQHRDQRDGQRNDGEADLLRAAQRRFERIHAAFDEASNILDHDDGVVDDETGGDGERHQRQIVEAEAEEIHRSECADQRQRHRQAGDNRARQRAQEHEDHQHDQDDRKTELEFHVRDRSADRHGAVAQNADVHGRRQRAHDLRQQRLDSIDDLNDVGAGLTLHVDDDCRRRIRPGAELGVLRAADDGGHVQELDRRAVAIGDDQITILIGAGELIVGIDSQSLGRAVEIAFRRIDVQIADRGADIVDVKTVGGKRIRIELDAHRRPLPAADTDESDAGQLRHFLREPGLAVILEVGQRQRLRSYRQRQDRCIGGIDFRVNRRRWQIGGKKITRSIDRGLDFLLGDVERKIEAELERDHRRSGGARRGHLVEPRHLPELPLQRRGDGRRHHLRTGAGIKRLHLNRRIIDLGQGRQRQERIGDHARQHDRRHQERRADRAQNEGFGDVHRTALSPRLIVTIAHGDSFTARHWQADSASGRNYGLARRPAPAPHQA